MDIIKRIISNTDWFDGYANAYKIERISDTNILNVIRKANHYNEGDVVIINISPKLLYYHCFVKILYPKKRFCLISIDLILSKPTNTIEKIKAKLLSCLFLRVNYFVLYMKECNGYKKYYNISDNQLEYIPFKINSLDKITQLDIKSESEYVFSGGVSKRDYITLLNAVKDIDIKLMVLVPPKEICSKHGTIISDVIPSNVTIIHDDFSVDSWNALMAKSKFVVIQIREDTISPTGVSTYLVAMAMKKCVIITECPATLNIIPNDCAVIIKPSNVKELQAAIIKVDTDEEFRNKIAENGYKYAMSLKGEERLISDIVQFVKKIHGYA